jgi:DNA topoisomerase I
MAKENLVVVESPTKAKTISKILGKDFSVVPSMGHLIDLPKKELGVDIEKNFEPTYVIIPGRKKILADLKKAGKSADHIYVATDPDREGEAIGWQLKLRIFKDKKVSRVVFHEITSSAIKDAFAHPREFEEKMIEAQAGRRILDRLVGYFLSPLLWKKIVRGLSAGRVQSVALRLIVDRERLIQKFVPQEYWEIEAQLQKAEGGSRKSEVFTAKLEKIGEAKAEIKTKEEAEKLTAEIKSEQFIVSEITQKEQNRYPGAPFITSTLQQEAFNKYRYNATKTMIIAQQLYEGIDIGKDNPVGLITYMRTDSTHVAAEAIKEVRAAIVQRFGQAYLPAEPNTYKVKKHAQEAHEAIRPTLLHFTPESIQQFLSPEQHKLYVLVYNRFMASQMTPARFLVTSVDIKAGKYDFTASGTAPLFDGFMVVYNSNKEEKEEKRNKIPQLAKDEALRFLELSPSQHFTKPPPRFSDSSLVKALEEEGIGRPSTYAPIIYTIIQRDYTRRMKGYFVPTELGFKVCDLLVEYFPKIMDVNFTARMEDSLDEVEEGNLDKIKVLQEFYQPFKESLEYAQKNIKKEVIESGEKCEQCGRPMVIKWGRKGKFLSCSGFPECKYAKSITTGVKCPQPDCGGELVQRRSARGFFYGCSHFPKCRFTSKELPENSAS